VFFVSFSFCRNQTRSISDANYDKEIHDSTKKNQLSAGDTVSSRQTNAKGSTKDSINRIVVIKHNVPNQNEIDSIKKAKLKGKK
jgi:hypothetical protein